MYALLAVVLHAIFVSATALVVAPYSNTIGATFQSLLVLGIASAALSSVGLVATAKYLSRHLRPASGITVGLLCGAVCSGILGLATDGEYDYSIIVYLALLVPALLAVVLASWLDRPKSGWQT